MNISAHGKYPVRPLMSMRLIEDRAERRKIRIVDK